MTIRLDNNTAFHIDTIVIFKKILFQAHMFSKLDWLCTSDFYLNFKLIFWFHFDICQHSNEWIFQFSYWYAVFDERLFWNFSVFMFTRNLWSKNKKWYALIKRICQPNVTLLLEYIVAFVSVYFLHPQVSHVTLIFKK